MEERPISTLSFRKFLNEEKLMGSQCKNCGAIFLPPRPICIHCNGRGMEWVELKGRGKLVAFTCIHVAPPWMANQGYDRQHPYCSGVVSLGEGLNIDARIVGVDVNEPDTIDIGIPLTADFLHRGDGEEKRTILAFKPLH